MSACFTQKSVCILSLLSGSCRRAVIAVAFLSSPLIQETLKVSENFRRFQLLQVCVAVKSFGNTKLLQKDEHSWWMLILCICSCNYDDENNNNLLSFKKWPFLWCPRMAAILQRSIAGWDHTLRCKNLQITFRCQHNYQNAFTRSFCYPRASKPKSFGLVFLA